MKESIQTLVKEKYAQMTDNDVVEIETARVSVPMPLSDSILFDVIAKHFGTNRSTLLSECLDIVAQDLFQSIADEDKISIAAETDELTVKALKGIYETYEHVGNHKWGSIAMQQTQPQVKES
jgi:ASC-1-like (ASCH) protein